MQLSRISARTWFWSLTFGLFLWAYIGTHTAPEKPLESPNAVNGFMLGAQGIVGKPVATLTIPCTWTLGFAQRIIGSTFRSIGASHYETRTVASLEEENRKLQDELAIKDSQMEELLKQISIEKAHAFQDIPPGNFREAYIVGRNPGAGAGTITIDKGSVDGIKAGMPVIAGVNHILGRITDVGPKSATVRLITDPNSKVMAMICRHEHGRTIQLLKDPCLVKGEGNGQFISDAIKVREADIQPGDIVQLMDREWPAKLQFFILGVVTEVGTNPKQMLRYEVRARANINEIQSVEVLLQY